MGSSAVETDIAESKRLSILAEGLGQAIAERDCILVTGATTGLPDLVTRSARRHGGLTVGISPAVSGEDHVDRYSLPPDGAEVIIYTGFGLNGRNVINVRSSDIVVVIGGGLGTLNEFTIAFNEGKVVGVLEGTGGAADKIREIVMLSSKQVGARVVYETSPQALIVACLRFLADA